MFMGEYHHTIDDKGRITIPSKIRELLGNDFVITRGLDNCLFIYRTVDFKELIGQYKNLPNIKDTRNFMRFLLSGAITGTFDKQGRINLDTSLMKYANLNKNCVVIGVYDRLEIWNEEDFNKFIESNEKNFSDIAEKLFSTNL